MGLSSCVAVYARHRHGADRDDDRRQAPQKPRRLRWWRVLAGLIAGLTATDAAADPLRVATYNVDLSRKGPGLLLRDIIAGDAPDIAAAANVISHVSPDILLLTGFDYDLRGHALAAFAERLQVAGANYPHRFSLAPNTGIATGRDMDADGRLGTPRDAQGYGTFAGQGGMAILSRFPVRDVQDYSALLWADMPGNVTAKLEGHIQTDVQRLSSVGHWLVTFDLPDGTSATLGAFHATPPVFDGPEDRNGWRNHDEAAFWLRYLAGALGPINEGPFILAGDANLDPADGDGRPAALNALLNHPLLQDAAPRSAGALVAAERDGGANTRQAGDAALDTADWSDTWRGPGNLRVDYVLPSIDWRIVDAGVFWPAPDSPEAALLGDGNARAPRHRLVWVDLMLKR